MANQILNSEIEQRYYIKNGNIKQASEFHLEALNTPSVYEVIRVIGNVPLFLEEHLERLTTSLDLINHSFKVEAHLLKKQIHQLIQLNENPQQNIKIIINDLDTQTPSIYLFFIPSSYPILEQYEKGVKTILFSAVRENPNVKAIVKSQREKLNTSIANANVYEAILVNENNEITEGSRSNIFIVKSDTLYTAPAAEVLIGVTRTRVLNLCRKLDIPIIETKILIGDLSNADGVFLTGTSPKILPIEMVDERSYPSSQNPVILKLRKAYDELIKEYVANYNKPLNN